MTEGKRFEKNFKDSVAKDTYYLRIVDPAIGFNIKDSKQRFSPKNPFDLILYKSPQMFCLELKSTKAQSISFAGSSPSIKKHQVKGLTKASKFCNAGFIFNFRSHNQTYYVTIDDFNEEIKKIKKKSLNIKDIKPIGLLIPSRKLQVNHRYDLSVLFDNCKNWMEL